MVDSDWQAILLTLQLAVTSTGILLLVGTPVAMWLAYTQSRVRKAVCEALIATPLVLPPTVLGFYLLLALSPRGPWSDIWETIGISGLAFRFEGLVLGSVIYSLPFVVQPLQNCLEAIPREYYEAAASLGSSPAHRFFKITLPMARNGFLTAAVLGFAHTIGEFGVVLMIGGNIPGETRVVSIAIYDYVEALEYSKAHYLAGGLVLTSLGLLLTIFILNKGWIPFKKKGALE